MLIPAPSVSAVLDEPWRCHSRTPNAITATILIVDDCGCSESSQDVSNHHALMTLSLIKYETAVFSNTEHCGFFGMNHLRQCSRMRTFAKNPRCRNLVLTQDAQQQMFDAYVRVIQDKRFI